MHAMPHVHRFPGLFCFDDDDEDESEFSLSMGSCVEKLVGEKETCVSDTACLDDDSTGFAKC